MKTAPTHRAAAHRATPLHPASRRIATLRRTSLRTTPQRHAPLRIASLRRTSRHIASHHSATQRKEATMRKCKVSFENFPGSPYSQSAKHLTPFLDRESHDDYDERTWREKCTTNDVGQVCAPAMAFKQAIDTTAFKLGQKVPNRRGATYKSFFASGFFVIADAPLVCGITGKPLTKENAVMKMISANSDGVRGSGKRVPRRFPEFPNYRGVVEATIIDDILTESVFEQHLRAAGLIVGIGRFRPENGGTNGRFRITNIEWETLAL